MEAGRELDADHGIIDAARRYIDACQLGYLWVNLWRSNQPFLMRVDIGYRAWNTISQMVRFYEEDMRIDLYQRVNDVYGCTVPMSHDVEQDLLRGR